MGNSLLHSDAGDQSEGVASPASAPLEAEHHPHGRRAPPAANDGGEPDGWKFAVTLGATELKRGDTVAMLLDAVLILPGARHHTRQLCLILTELFGNALDHGLLRLDTKLKARAVGLETYLQMKTQALAALEHGTIAISLELDAARQHPVPHITMRDSGAGFDYGACPSSAPPRGKGLALISALCAGVEYRGCGNEVRVSYALSVPQFERLRRMA